MLSHPGFIMNTRGADQAVAHGGTHCPGLERFAPSRLTNPVVEILMNS
jgi:hypothetical protein